METFWKEPRHCSCSLPSQSPYIQHSGVSGPRELPGTRRPREDSRAAQRACSGAGSASCLPHAPWLPSVWVASAECLLCATSQLNSTKQTGSQAVKAQAGLPGKLPGGGGTRFYTDCTNQRCESRLGALSVCIWHECACHGASARVMTGTLEAR